MVLHAHGGDAVEHVGALLLGDEGGGLGGDEDEFEQVHEDVAVHVGLEELLACLGAVGSGVCQQLLQFLQAFHRSLDAHDLIYHCMLAITVTRITRTIIKCTIAPHHPTPHSCL